MSVVGSILIPWFFLCSGFRLPLRPLLYFIIEFVIMYEREYVSLSRFTGEVEDPYADQTYV